MWRDAAISLLRRIPQANTVVRYERRAENYLGFVRIVILHVGQEPG
jgi:hypothetical protein